MTALPAWDDDEPDEPAEPGLLIDWPTFWGRDTSEEWLAEPLLPARRSTAMFAKGGTGKSLLALWIAVRLATGYDPMTGRRRPPLHVLYLDFEMTEDDLQERLEKMGYGPDDDLSHLHYALLPSLPPFDTKDGGEAIVALAELCDAQLVVIDTFIRSVEGEENVSDTAKNFHFWSGMRLKAAGRALLRIDHAGKDIERGQRGSSAKSDDVDLVWQLSINDDDVLTLKTTKRRVSWVPEDVKVKKDDDGEHLSYSLFGGETWPIGTNEKAAQLDELGLPYDVTIRVARDALKARFGSAGRSDLIAKALKWRRIQSGDPFTVGGESVTRESGNTVIHDNLSESGNKTPENATTRAGNTRVTPVTPTPDNLGNVPPYRGNGPRVPTPVPVDNSRDEFGEDDGW